MADPRFLLDANICVYLLDGVSEPARRRVEACDAGELVTSAIVFAEVMIGAHRRDAVNEALAFFRIVTVQPFDAAAGLAYARLPFRRGSFDRLIAAHALALGLTLVTNNEGDFADIPCLKVENWAE